MNVRLRRIEADAVIAIGGNLGDRAATFAAAVRALAEADGIEVTAISTPIETVAVRADGEDPDAPGYLNAVVLVRTTLSPGMLLGRLNAIERDNGRVRAERWGDRTLDLDIITLGGQRIDSPGLTIPHPRAGERDFVLAPWLQVDPDAELPGLGRIDALIARMPDDYPAEPLL